MRDYLMMNNFQKAPLRINFNPTEHELKNAQNAILREDMQIIYSMSIITLQNDFGFNQKQLEKFINRTQERWVNWAKEDRETREKPVDMCGRVTGIQLKSIWEEEK